MNRKQAIESSASWSAIDRVGLAFAWFIGLLFCAICAAIVIYLLVQGLHYLHPDLLWTNPKAGNSQNETGGFLAPMLGTLFVTGLAMLLATPVGIGVAVWLSEYARPRALARIVDSTVEMFAGAPSIVLALFGVILFRASFLAFLTERNGGVVYGRGFFPAAAMLSLLALPLVVTSVREGLQAIPNHVREASYAVGKTKIATIRRVLLPAVRPDIITGSMVGAGHAIGDTAIIVFLLGDTLTLQGVGNVPVLGILRGTGSTLTSYVYDNAPTGDFNQPNKAFAAALVLLVIVLIINVVVDIFGRKAREVKWT
ncbi:MAG TPA: ABC transporter permease subunit [Solirubrobacteraceae bacterium]|jgi:phosphate transport system permease protein|nr:ABC transporter permease subunit [Solirubrobacteraceae bacterium]